MNTSWMLRCAAAGVAWGLLAAFEARGDVYTPVDLNPTGYDSSQGLAIDQGRAVGSATPHATQPQPPQAALWNGSAGNFAPLEPSPPILGRSQAMAISGNQQAGIGSSASGSLHAVLWGGTPDTLLDIHPAQFGLPNSTVAATNGVVQAGWVSIGVSNLHAVLWSGSAQGAVMLQPTSGWSETSVHALSPDGTTQVGSGLSAFPIQSGHALMWHGTAASLTDLTPQGVTGAELLAASNAQQAGDVTVAGSAHAGLWNGTAQSFLDIHPAGFASSHVQAIAGAQAVGYGASTTVLGDHALLWSGTTGNVTDLSQFIPQTLVAAGFINSYAMGIDSQGNVVGYIQNRQTNVQHAFEWIPQGFGGLAAAEGRLLQTAMPGDANFDGSVNFSDLLRLAQHYGVTGANWSVGDFNADDTVSFPDLLTLAQNYGTAPALPLAAVPEPVIFWLLLTAAVALGGTRGRRIAGRSNRTLANTHVDEGSGTSATPAAIPVCTPWP